MKKIDYFLTREYANKYNEKRYSIRWLYTETYGGEDKLSAQFDKDMIHYDLFRKELSQALSEQEENLVDITKRWIYLIKPRIERLDFWSKLWSAFLAVLIAALGVYSVLSGIVSKSFLPWLFPLLISILPFALGVLTFDVEKKKLWYKYVLSHLEAILEKEC